MQVEIIETNKNHYKIISKSSSKHPVLVELAELLKQNNKHSELKIGIFSVPTTKFSCFQRVYSFISGKSELLSKAKYYRFLKGQYKIKDNKKPWRSVWKPLKPEEFDVEALGV